MGAPPPPKLRNTAYVWKQCITRNKNLWIMFVIVSEPLPHLLVESVYISNSQVTPPHVDTYSHR